jgi:hypothetical protein
MTLPQGMQAPRPRTPKQKRRGKAPRRFDDPQSGVTYADFAMISSAILRGTGS